MDNSSNKCACGRWKSPDAPICGPCAMDEKERKRANAKGGLHSRKIPHHLRSSDLLPIDNGEDLKRFLNALLGQAIDNVEDIKALAKISLPIVDKFSTIFELELLESAVHQLKVIKAKKNGKLLEAGSYAPKNQTTD